MANELVTAKDLQHTHDAIQRRGNDHLVPGYFAVELIERIDRAETDNVRISENYVQLECRYERLESELEEWTTYFGCDSPHDTYIGRDAIIGAEQVRTNRAENRVNGLETELATLRAKNAELADHICDVAKSYCERGDAIESLRAENARLQDEIDLRVEQGAALNQDKENYKAKVARLEAPVTFGEAIKNYKEEPSEQYDIAVRARCRMVQAIIAARAKEQP